MTTNQIKGEYVSPSVQTYELRTQDVIAASPDDFTVTNPWEHMTEDTF